MFFLLFQPFGNQINCSQNMTQNSVCNQVFELQKDVYIDLNTLNPPVNPLGPVQASMHNGWGLGVLQLQAACVFFFLLDENFQTAQVHICVSTLLLYFSSNCVLVLLFPRVITFQYVSGCFISCFLFSPLAIRQHRHTCTQAKCDSSAIISLLAAPLAVVLSTG